jgi:hypothetical protein
MDSKLTNFGGWNGREVKMHGVTVWCRHAFFRQGLNGLRLSEQRSRFCVKWHFKNQWEITTAATNTTTTIKS